MHILRDKMDIESARHGLDPEHGDPITEMKLANSRLKTVDIREFDDTVGISWVDSDGERHSLALDTTDRMYTGLTLPSDSDFPHWDAIPTELHACLNSIGYTIVSDVTLDDI